MKGSSGIALAQREPEEKLSEHVWIACESCRTPMQLSVMTRREDGLRVCPQCTRGGSKKER